MQLFFYKLPLAAYVIKRRAAVLRERERERPGQHRGRER
jgi:hypothetical protein